MRYALLLFAVSAATLSGCATPTPGADELRGERAELLRPVEPFGTPDTLDAATWNIEWFGSRARGPRDEPLQRRNAADLIAASEVDLWALQEITSDFGLLLDALPGYRGLLASDPSIPGNQSFGRGEQKLALVWRDDVLAFESAEIILRGDDFAFAGRPPLEGRFRVRRSGAQLRVIVIHAKAGTANDDWRRRAQGAEALAGYLGNLRDEEVLLLGDFNDDLDQSTRGSRPSPYAVLVQDTFAPTFALAQANVRTSFGRLPVDHAFVTGSLAERYERGSAEAWDVDGLVDRYRSTTSDHLPVRIRFAFTAGSPPPPPPSAEARLEVTEVLANEPGSDTRAEAIEFVNTGGETLDVGSYSISDAGELRHRFPPGTMLSPGQVLVVDAGAGVGIPASTGRLAFNNGGDIIVIRNRIGTEVTRITYESAGPDGVSLVPGDVPGSWVSHQDRFGTPSSLGQVP